MPVFTLASKKKKKAPAASRASKKEEEEASDNEPTQQQEEKAAASENAVAVAVDQPAAAAGTNLEFNEPAAWVERMALTATKALPSDLAPDDDPKREEVFIQHALLSVLRGLHMLEKAGVPWKRPADYYAEMVKSDVHMDQLRESILKSKKQVELRAHRRAMKDQKKFGMEVQAEVIRQRAKHKRDLTDRLNDWKKKRRGGEREDIDDVINRDDDDGGDGGGHGGKKARFERGGGGGGKKGRAATRKPTNLRPGGAKKSRPGKNSRSRKS